MCQLQPILHKQRSSNYLRNNTGKKFKLKLIRLTINLVSFQSKAKNSTSRVNFCSKTEKLTEAIETAHCHLISWKRRNLIKTSTILPSTGVVHEQ